MILVVTGYHLVIIVVRIQEIEAKTETRVRQTQGAYFTSLRVIYLQVA